MRSATMTGYIREAITQLGTDDVFPCMRKAGVSVALVEKAENGEKLTALEIRALQRGLNQCAVFDHEQVNRDIPPDEPVQFFPFTPYEILFKPGRLARWANGPKQPKLKPDSTVDFLARLRESLAR